MDESGEVSYEVNTTRKIRGSAKRMMEQIDDQSINVNLRTMGGSVDSDGRLLVGGAFKGKTVTTNPDGSVTVEAYQDVNPNVLGAADEHTNSPGRMMMHEMTEAYEGAAISKASGISSPAADDAGSVYPEAHNRATYQTTIFERAFDSSGNIIPNSKDATKVEWFVRDMNGNEKVIQILIEQ